MPDEPKKPPTPTELAVGALFMSFYNLRKNGQVQEEYDNMGTLIDMLMTERQHMRVKYKGQIKI